MPRPWASAHFDSCCHSQLSVGRQFRVTWERGGWIKSRRGSGGLRRVTLARHFASQVKLGILLLATPHPPSLPLRELAQVAKCESDFWVTQQHYLPYALPRLPPAYCNYRPRLLLKASCGSRVIHQQRGAWGKWQVASGNLSEMREAATTAAMRWYFSCFLANFNSNTDCHCCPHHSSPPPSFLRLLFMASSCGRCHFAPLLHLPFDIICISPTAEIRLPDGPTCHGCRYLALTHAPLPPTSLFLFSLCLSSANTFSFAWGCSWKEGNGK